MPIAIDGNNIFDILSSLYDSISARANDDIVIIEQLRECFSK